MSNGKKWKMTEKQKRRNYYHHPRRGYHICYMGAYPGEHTKVGGAHSKFRYFRNKKYVKKIFEECDHFGFGKLRDIEMWSWGI